MSNVVLVMNMKKLMKNKKGQLFLIEAFIAVSVMIIMVTALYEVQIATQPTPELYFQEDVYITLKALDNEGLLDEYLYTIKTGTPAEIRNIKDIIQAALYGSLPDNGEFILHCENLTSSQIVTDSWINEGLAPGKETIGVDYLITEVYGDYDPYIYHLQLWLKGV
jgi:hypothetical protein